MYLLSKKFNLCYVLIAAMLFSACDDAETPEAENEEEIITDVTLTFTPEGGGTAITATAKDADGEGPGSLAVVKDIELAANTTYTLTLDLQNSIEMESITEEIEKEDDEHMFFFGFTNGLFSDPTGTGNIGAGNRDKPLNYEDDDAAGNPLGLETKWTTGDAATGTFRVILKHQPDLKTTTSDSTIGGSDVDISWDIEIQ